MAYLGVALAARCLQWRCMSTEASVAVRIRWKRMPSPSSILRRHNWGGWTASYTVVGITGPSGSASGSGYGWQTSPATAGAWIGDPAAPPETFHAIAIDAFDASRLRRSCEELLRRIAAPATNIAATEDARLALEALARIRHPLAVEYLARSIDVAPDLAGIRAAEALSGLGTPEAVNALNEIARIPGIAGEQAQLQLRQLQYLNEHPELREHLRVAKQATEAGAPLH